VFATAAAYDKCMAILENRGYLKQRREVSASGRAQSVVELNPLWTKPPVPLDKAIRTVRSEHAAGLGMFR
jgi:hypothetical protein